MGSVICSGCDRPEPHFYCWDGIRLDCPFRKPPRIFDTDDLWPILVDQQRRIEALEQRSEIEHPTEAT